MKGKNTGIAIAVGTIAVILFGMGTAFLFFVDKGHAPAPPAGGEAPVAVATSQAATEPADPVHENPATIPATPIGVESNFECGVKLTFNVVSDSHVVVTLDRSVSNCWWMFRLTGVAGKKVQVDVKAPRDIKKWTTLNPVYSDVADLDDPDNYHAGKSTDSTLTAAQVTLPSTDNQKWHYIADAFVSETQPNTFVFNQQFTSDSVWIANRIPYPPLYNEKFIKQLEGNPLAKVIDIGTSANGRRLSIVQIDSGDDEQAKKKPCVVICAGEQADQPDGMWATRGAIEYLLGGSDRAKQLRDKCRFLMIPVLDPDGTTQSSRSFVGRFQPGAAVPVAIAYADFFQKWILAGNRLDVVLELHGLESNESPHLLCARLDGGDRAPFADAFNDLTLQTFSEAKYETSHSVWVHQEAPFRFGGWLEVNYGAFYFAYELNPQDPTRHLDLSELKDMGRVFAEAMGNVFGDDESAKLLKSVDDARAAHLAKWNGCPATKPSQNALESEAAAMGKPDADEPGN